MEAVPKKRAKKLTPKRKRLEQEKPTEPEPSQHSVAVPVELAEEQGDSAEQQEALLRYTLRRTLRSA